MVEDRRPFGFAQDKPFVVVEGGSGSGKTTAIKSIKPHLEGWRFLREPGGTDFGELMRIAVQEHKDLEIDPMAAFMAYSASRANLVNLEILPILTGIKSGQGVFLDRYWFSSYAYQGSEKVSKAVILQISKEATGGLMPDLVLHFDLVPELSIMRKEGCSDVDRYDLKELSFHARVRDAYLELSAQYPEIWKVIDASRSQEQVLADCLAILRERGII
ncbi:TPA: dTMP kinase [Candidatus Collierbacteria bacterium]|uniref:Thymidylate kinase n=1 Tax=Candidatus Collierbacteria bacterium GW2011_GWB2_44_22 TaxID=1618387 RepID=A0A0G1HYP3_9BACT|nr:MAG: Thymidylate kinase [Candidatus Collierbacteria bacterium GW2011_GWA2_44_13]KKT51683.1 MAG: Thymidylate kinase [Candidatus Collierbacteria bacterium GW2011_GWB2_44_22]KKT62481.1 MAG: Thymidylate kinase [Candidatus Collierbacteria bacterium GW2011_GWD1_44_27]KKT66901.1 MAG: Thymidylate kinase [Candidatus Collierbacteria bacterium GW2011_GWC2_44_30]KKT88730.1 MAG: Thymidylate kinase [Candidatus Collierbacteria bacterium GW2011_GWD2_45_10]HCQ31563.1 dTMP kinase [Candidatus Collierbacteria 